MAIVATVYLFLIVKETAGGLRKGFLLLAVGVLISLGIHSFAEFLEAYGFLDIEVLLSIMPVFVFVGTCFLISGVYFLYTTLRETWRGKR